MSNKNPPEKPTTREVESQVFDPESIDDYFDAALDAAIEKVKEAVANKEGLAKVEYQFRGGIKDGAHLDHVTVTDVDGTILYDQDFDLEHALMKQADIKKH